MVSKEKQGAGGPRLPETLQRLRCLVSTICHVEYTTASCMFARRTFRAFAQNLEDNLSDSCASGKDQMHWLVERQALFVGPLALQNTRLSVSRSRLTHWFRSCTPSAAKTSSVVACSSSGSGYRTTKVRPPRPKPPAAGKGCTCPSPNLTQ